MMRQYTQLYFVVMPHFQLVLAAHNLRWIVVGN